MKTVFQVFQVVSALMVCALTRSAGAQVDPEIGLPMNAVIGGSADIGTRVVEVEDFSGDNLPDYLVGVPHAQAGVGVLAYVTGPAPAAGWRVSDIRGVVRVPSILPIAGLGGAVTAACDINLDGRREVWATCSISNSAGQFKHSVLHFDTTTLRVTYIAADVTAIETVWSPSFAQSPPGWAELIAPYLPLNLDDPAYWGTGCPTCQGGPIGNMGGPGNLYVPQPSTPGAAGQPPSTGVLKIGAWLIGNLTGGAQGEVKHWYAATKLTLGQTAVAVSISKDAKTLGAAKGWELGGGDLPARLGFENAARHAYWQMMLTFHLGAELAQQIGDAHEIGQNDGGQTLEIRRDSWIDLFNNARGRELVAMCQSDGECTEEELKALWNQALRNGFLITDECDSRVPGSLRDCEPKDGQADGDECALQPGVNPIMAPRLNSFGFIASKKDIDGEGFITVSDVQAVVDDLGEINTLKDQNGDCEVWTDDAVAVLEAVES